jgi:CubicO group peptidase (beta-lactamase class C family)
MPTTSILHKAATAAAVIACAFAPVQAAAQGRLPAPLEAYVERSMAAAQVPGLAIAFVRLDEPPIAQGFGLRRLGRPERVDADTLFNIASLTKSFTAAAAGTLVDEGRLAWDDPVARWLPQVQFADPWLTRHVTVGDLLSHRTGLQSANTAWYMTGVGRDEILRRVRFLEPAAPFRTAQVYNNALYVVAGEALAAAAGTSFEDLIRTRLIVPLGMTSTRLTGRLATSGNVAAPHAVLDGRHEPIRAADYAATAAAGGIDSTARDMTRWLRFQLGDGTFEGRRILAPDTLRTMHEPWVLIPTTPAMRAARQVRFFAGYGLGWNVMDYRGETMIWHSGNADGMPSYMALLPERRIGVVVMLNSWIAPFLHGDIASRILDHYLGLPTRDYAAETLAATRAAEARAAAAPPPAGPPASPALDLGAYAGVYRSDLYGPIVLRREGTLLVLKLGEGEEAELRPLARDVFAVRWRDRVSGFRDDRAAFALDAQGRVVRLTMQVGRDLVEARRAPAS